MTDPMLETRPADSPHGLDPPAIRPPATERDDELVEADLLIEDVSIDGMCGVY